MKERLSTSQRLSAKAFCKKKKKKNATEKKHCFSKKCNVLNTERNDEVKEMQCAHLYSLLCVWAVSLGCS